MSILKSSSKSKGIDGKLVGIVFPKELHSYFSLFALAKGLTKSIIVKREMERWYDLAKNHIEGKEDILIEEISAKIREEWKVLKIKKPEKSFAAFKKELKSELKRKGIHTENIKLILKNI